MRLSFYLVVLLSLTALLPAAAQPDDAATANRLAVSIELPRLRVAEYHPPYVATWIQDADDAVAANLAVWYQLDEDGKKWLKDMRLWWRRTGRSLDMPVDGIAGATRRPDTHQLVFAADQPPLADLEAGDYRLFVEAARENGGREVVSLPFTWPPSERASSTAEGEHELGTVELVLAP